MMIKNSILRNHRIGSESNQLIRKLLAFLELEHKGCGKIKMDYATGEESEFSNTFQRVKDLKDTGKTQRKNAVYKEYLFYSTMKIQGYLLRDSSKRTKIGFMQTHLSSIITILRICPLIKFLKSTMRKLIEF